MNIEERLSKRVEEILSQGIIECEEINLTQEKLIKSFNEVLEYTKNKLLQQREEAEREAFEAALNILQDHFEKTPEQLFEDYKSKKG